MSEEQVPPKVLWYRKGQFIIGLGGWGSILAAKIYKLLKSPRYSPADVKEPWRNVEILFIDLDEDWEKNISAVLGEEKLSEKGIFLKIRWPSYDAICRAYGIEVGRIMATRISTGGTGRTRSAAAVALSRKGEYRLLYHHIHEKVAKLQQHGHADIDFIVTTTSGGGAGSGLTPHIIDIIRETCNTLNVRRYRIFVIVILPESKASSLELINTYALLKELDMADKYPKPYAMPQVMHRDLTILLVSQRVGGVDLSIRTTNMELTDHLTEILTAFLAEYNILYSEVIKRTLEKESSEQRTGFDRNDLETAFEEADNEGDFSIPFATLSAKIIMFPRSAIEWFFLSEELEKEIKNLLNNIKIFMREIKSITGVEVYDSEYKFDANKLVEYKVKKGEKEIIRETLRNLYYIFIQAKSNVATQLAKLEEELKKVQEGTEAYYILVSKIKEFRSAQKDLEEETRRKIDEIARKIINIEKRIYKIEQSLSELERIRKEHKNWLKRGEESPLFLRIPIDNVELFRNYDFSRKLLIDILEYMDMKKWLKDQLVTTKPLLLIDRSGLNPIGLEQQLRDKLGVKSDEEWKSRYKPIFSKYMPLRARIYIPLISTAEKNIRPFIASVNTLFRDNPLAEKIPGSIGNRFICYSSFRGYSIFVAELIYGLPITNPQGRKLFAILENSEKSFKQPESKSFTCFSYPMYYNSSEPLRGVAEWLGFTSYNTYTELLNKIVDLVHDYEIGGFKQLIGLCIAFIRLYLAESFNSLKRVESLGKELIGIIEKYFKSIETDIDKKILAKLDKIEKLVEQLNKEFEEKGEVSEKDLRKPLLEIRGAIVAVRDLVGEIQRLRDVLRGRLFQDLLTSLNVFAQKTSELLSEVKKLDNRTDIQSTFVRRDLRDQQENIGELLSALQDFVNAYRTALSEISIDLVSDIIHSISEQVDKINSYVDDIRIYVSEDYRVICRYFERFGQELENITDELNRQRDNIEKIVGRFNEKKENLDKIVKDLSEHIDNLNNKLIIAI